MASMTATGSSAGSSAGSPTGSARASGRLRRDRRGRGRRGPLAWPPVPAMASRREQFDDLVLDAASRLESRLAQRHPDVEFAVEDVPPSDPAPWESSVVPLGRLFPAQGKLPPRIVLYRRPIESRAHDTRELTAIVQDVVVEQVAALLGVTPEQLDPRYGDDFD